MLATIFPKAILDILVIPSLLAISLVVGRALAGPLARLPLYSFVERLLIYWLLGIIAISWIGTILAGLGLFRWWLLLAVLLALAGWALWRQRHSASPMESSDVPLRSTPLLASLLLVVLLIGAGWLYARPAESFLLTDDSAVYMIGGIVLARDGSLFYEPEEIYEFHPNGDPSPAYWEPSASRLDDFWIPYQDFYRQFFLWETVGIPSRHYGPFFRWTLPRSTLEIGFLPLPKVWAAMSVWLFGQPYAPWAVPFFGLTGLAALYGLARRLVGWQAGLASMLLLGVSLPQVWFARFPVSEMHTQALFLGGLYLAVLARQNRKTPRLARRFALWSGLALAALTILRLEALLILAPLTVLLVLGWGRKSLRRGGFARTWLVALLLAGGFGTLLSVSVARYYLFTRSLIPASPATVRFLLAMILALLLGGVLLWNLRQQHETGVQLLASRVVGWLPALVAGGWVLWAGVALWHLFGRPWGSSLAGWLVQYWTRPGLALSTVGALWLLCRNLKGSDWPEMSVLLGLAALFLLLYSVNALVTPAHPWAMRRLVPIVMPALALCAAALLTEGLARMHLDSLPLPLQRIQKWAAPPVAILALVLQTFALGQRSYPLLHHREREGLWDQIVALESRFAPGALLLFDDGPIGKRLTQSMELIFGHPSFVLQGTEVIHSDSPVVDRLIGSAMARQCPVYFVLTDGDVSWRPEQWQLLGEGAQRFDMPVLRYAWGRPPVVADIARHVFWADIYRVLPAEQGATKAMPSEGLAVPVGAGSYPYLRSGFHGREEAEDGSVFRWTKGEALITVPWPQPDPAAPADFCLRLDISTWRPAEEGSLSLIMEAEGIELFDQTLDKAGGRQTLEILARSIENRNSPDLEIKLISDTWNAAEFTDQRDQRELGLVFFGMRLSPLDQCLDSQ